jgi:flagellar basal-body rod protein FlgB
MPISDIPIFSMLRTKMQWHQERQRLLAENVSNADTPNFRPRDLAPPKFDRRATQAPAPLVLAQTSPGHIAGTNASGTPQFPVERKSVYEIRPAGNAVNLEDEMLKVAANQMDYQTAATLYQRGLGLIKTALGQR